MKIALFGYGYWGKNVARTMRECGLDVLIHDPDERTAFQAAEAGYECSRTKECLTDDDVDAVAICAPQDQHDDLIHMALDAKKHIWTEKPISRNHTKARVLAKIAKEYGLVLFVDHTFTFAPAVDCLAANVPTHLLHVEGARTHHCDPRIGANVISDLLPHDVSILLRCNLVISEIRAVSRMLDTVIDLRFNNGATGTIYLSWMSAFKQRRMIMYGPLSTVVYDHLNPHTPVIQYLTDKYAPESWAGGTVICPSVPSTEPLSIAVRQFVKACKGQCEDNSFDALRVQNIVDGALMSEGEWVTCK